MIERQPLGRFLDLDDARTRREMASFREPDVLEEWPAQENDEIGAIKRFANLRRIRRKRLTEAGMAGREGRMVPQSFEPDRCADRLR